LWAAVKVIFFSIWAGSCKICKGLETFNDLNLKHFDQKGATQCNFSFSLLLFSLYGGAHRPDGFAEADESLLPIKREEGSVTFDTKGVKRASEMESYLIWDSSQKSSVIYELAAYPCLAAACQDECFEKVIVKTKHIRGKWEKLVRVGTVLANAPSIKFLLGDGHTSHRWVHELLLGQKIPLPEEMLERAPFWKDLKTSELPVSCIPLPYRLVSIDGCNLHYIPGLLCKQLISFEGLLNIVDIPCFRSFLKDEGILNSLFWQNW